MKARITKSSFILLFVIYLFFGTVGLWGQSSRITRTTKTAESEKTEEEKILPSVTVRASILNGPTAIPSVYMIEKSSDGKKIYSSQTIGLTFEKFADPQALLPKLIKNEIDVGFLPVNVAAKFYGASKKSIVCAGITGNTNLVLITKDKSIDSLKDLSDKTVYIAGQGATPEYLFRWLLKQDSISNVNLDYSIPTANLAGQIIAGKIDYAVVPEPFATVAVSKSKDVLYALDLQKEYERIAGKGESVPFTVVVASRKFAENNPEALNEYLDLLEKSMNWVIKNPVKAGEYCEKQGIGIGASVAAAAIPKSNYVFEKNSKAQKKIEKLLNIFIDLDKKAVGETLPDSSFYYCTDEKKD